MQHICAGLMVGQTCQSRYQYIYIYLPPISRWSGEEPEQSTNQLKRTSSSSARSRDPSATGTCVVWSSANISQHHSRTCQMDSAASADHGVTTSVCQPHFCAIARNCLGCETEKFPVACVLLHQSLSFCLLWHNITDQSSFSFLSIIWN